MSDNGIIEIEQNWQHCALLEITDCYGVLRPSVDNMIWTIGGLKPTTQYWFSMWIYETDDAWYFDGLDAQEVE